MKKTMKKSALLSSVAMLIVSAIVLTSATYAWFSSSKKVTVNELEASVVVSTGLVISVDKGGNWGTSFKFDDAVAFEDGWGKASEIEYFNPVSTANGEDWFKGVYEKGELNEVTMDALGKDFVAVPLWVSGPANAKVNVNVDFAGTEGQTLECMKFAILRVNADGSLENYTKAVAADGTTGTFNGISAAGTVNNTDENDEENAFVSDGGKTINEVAAEGGFYFTIDEGTTATAEGCMKFVVFVWLEGNDEDCAMLQFDPKGEDIEFSMALEIVEEA